MFKEWLEVHKDDCFNKMKRDKNGSSNACFKKNVSKYNKN